jgi:hypothetical protein
MQLLETAVSGGRRATRDPPATPHVQVNAGLYDGAIENCGRVLAVDPPSPVYVVQHPDAARGFQDGLTLVQVLGLLLLWPVALFPWLAATPAPLRHEVLSMHVSIFWDVAFPSWLLLFGPPAAVLGLWLVSRRRASRERPGRS